MSDQGSQRDDRVDLGKKFAVRSECKGGKVKLQRSLKRGNWKRSKLQLRGRGNHTANGESGDIKKGGDGRKRKSGGMSQMAKGKKQT